MGTLNLTAGNLLTQGSLFINKDENPFVTIPNTYLILIYLYFIIFRVMIPLFKMIMIGSDLPLSYTRFSLILIFDLLLFAPIFLLRKKVGFFHPLVFLLLFTISMGIMENPLQLISFLTEGSFFGKINVTAGPLSNFNQADLALLEIKLLLLTILSQVCIYLGYFLGIKWNIYHFPQWQPKGLKFTTFSIVFVSLILMIFYINSKGGITAHFSSFGLGRETAVGGDGFIHALINFGFLATLVWFAYDENALKNPLFWIALIITVPSQFILRGSRSSIVFASLLLLVVYMIKSKKIPTVQVLVLVFGAVMIIGLLGALRKSSFGSKEVNWEILSDFNVGSSLELYVDDVEHREAQQPSLTALAKGVQQEGLLFGKTYLGGFLFFVPRVIWPDKPHSIGFYTGTLLYGSTGGKPPGDVVEAYWNFHIVGVIIIFFLFGTFLNWLARILIHNQGNITVYIIFLILLLFFKPSNLGIIKTMQQLLPILLILWLIGVIPPKLRFNSFSR